VFRTDECWEHWFDHYARWTTRSCCHCNSVCLSPSWFVNPGQTLYHPGTSSVLVAYACIVLCVYSQAVLLMLSSLISVIVSVSVWLSPTVSGSNNVLIWPQIKQEGQHPLTGQRAANFRLLANQWAERRLVMQCRHGCHAMRRSVCNADASNAGRSFAFRYEGNGATPCQYIDTTRKAIDCATTLPLRVFI